MDLRHISQLNENDKSLILSEQKRLMSADVMAGAGRIEVGRDCYKYVVGDIFTDSEMAEIEAAEKVPVQTAEGLTKIASIVGNLAQSAKDGVIVGSSEEDAAPAELRELLLKEDIEVNSDMARLEMQIAQDVLVTGVPTFAWIEPFDPDDVNKHGLTVQYCPWDSIITDGAWRDPMMRDMRRIHRIKQMSYTDLVERFKNMDLDTEEKVKQYEQIYYRSGSRDSNEFDFLSARQGVATTPLGMVNVVETLQFVYMDFPVIIDQYGMPNTISPFKTEQEVQEMLQANPGSSLGSKKQKILWSAVWTYSGILLDYGPHWLQVDRFPCVPFVPANLNGKWMGVIESCRDILKDLSYLMTERLQGYRTVNNNLWKAKRSAVADADEFEESRKRAGATVWVEDEANLDDVNPVPNVRESGAFNDAIEASQDMLSRLTVERNFEGGAQASQESGQAIGARIQQGLSKISFYVHGWHNYRRQIRSLIVKAMPTCYPVEKIIRKVDPTNGMVVEQTVNQVVSYDWNGEANRLKNDLSSGEFDYMMTEADNSSTGKDVERAIMLDFMKSYGNLPPEMLAIVAAAFPSEAVKKMGNQMMEKQKQQEQMPPPQPVAKVSFNISSAELGSEASLKIAEQAGALPPEPQAPPEQSPQEEQIEGAASNPQEESLESPMPGMASQEEGMSNV